MTRAGWLTGAALLLALLSGCGGDSSPGVVASTPVPAPAPTAAPTPAPVPSPAPAVNYNTAEYQRSNAAVQAQAITAYNNGATGQGVLVGVIDSGVNASSPEFAGRISPLSGDFAGSRGIGDEGGHGTAVSDVLLGGKDDSGIHGVAFNATLLVLRTDTPGSCVTAAMGSSDGGCSHNDNAIAAGLDAATAARARVVNISLGGSPPNSKLRDAIDRATAAGTIIVISAGNDGVTSPTAAANPDMLAQVANEPIAHGLVLIAGSVDPSDTLSDFSNKAGNGAAHYLAALGRRVRAVDQTGTAYLYSGTSFSAPAVAGAVALLAQAFPSLTPAQIVSLLYRSATDLGATGVDTTYGNGELNIARAFQPQGSTSIGKTAIAVSLTNNATLGAAMGDAGQGSLGAVIRDSYGRDFAVDLGTTVRRTVPQTMLAAALTQTSRTFAAEGRRASVAVSLADAAPQPLMLSSADARRASLLAGAASFEVTKTLHLGIGGGRGADGLAPAPQDVSTPAFLIADHSLQRAPQAAFALRQRLGGIAVTIAAESGDMQLWQTSDFGPRADGVRRYGYSTLTAGGDTTLGPVALSGKISRLDERATVLGGQLGAALGGSGAVTCFADVGVTFTPVRNWRFDAAYRQGWTRLSANEVRGLSTLGTRALSIGGTRDQVLVAGDRLSVRYMEPLRVTSGGLDLLYSDPLSLTPKGRERDWEGVYTRPLGTGVLSLNAYLRQQPGNFASAPRDVGAAVRYGFAF